MTWITLDLRVSNVVTSKLGLCASIGVLCWAAAGCAGSTDGGDVEDLGEWPSGEEVAATGQALSCQGASCDGLNPQQTSCVQDQEDTRTGIGVFDRSGRQIGGLALFRSRSCQTVWAASAFYTSGGPRDYRICTVRRRAAENDPSCFDYSGSFGNVGPMKFAPSGKTVFGRLTNDSLGIKAVTPDYIVP